MSTQQEKIKQPKRTFSSPINLGLELTDSFLNFAFKKCFTFSALFNEAANLFGLNLKRIRKGKDSSTEAIVKILEAAVAERKAQQAEPHWTERFGAMVANLYGDNLTALTHNELCCSVMEIANKGNTPPNEARLMLPLGLQQIFDEPPFIRVILHVNNKSLLLCDLIEGDLVQNFETLINSINEICRPLDIPEDGKQGVDMPVLTVELIRNDGVSFDIYKQFFPKEALNSLSDFYKQNLGKEPAAEQAKASEPIPGKAAPSAPPDVEKVIRANRFELIDEGGEVCARLQSMRGIMGTGRRTIFSMGGTECRSIQMVSDTDTGEMAFRILEGGEFYPISFGVFIRPDDPRPMLEIGGSCKVGNSYLRLAVEEDMSSPSIKLYDRDDNVRAKLSLSEDGTPHFELCENVDDEDENSTLQVLSDEDYSKALIEIALQPQTPKEISSALLKLADAKLHKCNKREEKKPLPVFNLCDYEKLSLDFYLTEDDDKAFNFELVRGHRDTDEIYFNTEGVNRTSFNRDGYNFPLRDNHKGEGREDITLSGNGEIEILGYKDERAFLLTWRRIEGHFEAEFDLYDAKGNVVQTFSILE